MLRIAGNQSSPRLFPVEESLSDHYSLIDGFVKSQKARGLEISTIEKEEKLIRSWFELHGPEGRPLFV